MLKEKMSNPTLFVVVSKFKYAVFLMFKEKMSNPTLFLIVGKFKYLVEPNYS